MAFRSDRVLGNKWSIRGETQFGFLERELRQLVLKTAPGVSVNIKTMADQIGAALLPEGPIAAISTAFSVQGCSV